MFKVLGKLAMVALICVTAGGCGGSSSSGGSIGHVPAVTYQISGTVTSDGAPLPGATVTLGGGSAATASTDSSGNYRFTGLASGSYTLTCTKANYSSLPKVQACLVNGADVSGANFTAAPSSTIFYVVDAEGQLAEIDIAAKTGHIIGNTGVLLNDIAFAPNGVLYGVSDSSLYTIDLTNAVATPVGPLGIPDTTSLEFSVSGTLYTANSALYTLNTSTGTAQLVGSGGVAYQSSGDLVFLGSQLYLTAKDSLTNDNLLKLDPATGAAAKIGAVNYPTVFGLATNDEVTLYGFSGTKLLVIDTATGAGNELWDMASIGNLKAINGAAAH